MNTRSLAGAARATIALASGLVIASCIIQQEPPPGQRGLPANTAQPGAAPAGTAPAVAAGLGAGEYACSISSQGFSYPPFRCVVYSAENGGVMLEKMGGSQRFRGAVASEGAGFRFNGTFYCPHGDCTQEVSGSFHALGDGSFQGTLSGATQPNQQLLVTLRAQPGGFTYGGAMYGGAAYGGARYAAPPPPAAVP